MEEMTLFTIFSLPVTGYALSLCCVALLFLGFALLLKKRSGLNGDSVLFASALILPLGLLFARVLFCLVNFNRYQAWGMDSMLRLWEGGYMLWGVVLGAAAALVIASRVEKCAFAQLADHFAAPAALAIMLGRLCEYLCGQGFGEYVDDEALCFFPLSVCIDDSWRFCIFSLEAICALMILIILLMKKRPQGQTALLFLTLYSACQILPEQLRHDSVSRWLFVPVSQLICCLVMLSIVLFCLIKSRKTPSYRRMLVHFALFALGAGLCIVAEFFEDGKIIPNVPEWACLLMMALGSILLGIVTWQSVKLHYAHKAVKA